MPSERTLGGKYRLGDVLGSGSMGTVYAARREDGAEVAVKVLHGHLSAEPEIVTRFAREARIARRIESPFVAKVFEAGRGREGDLWIAFERLHGESLEKRLRRERTLRFDDVHRVVEDVLQGLLAAHEVGAVHRDIKPGNVFLEQGSDGRFWRARILDFGVSKMRTAAVETDHGGLTTDDDFLGSPSFMAPEQIDSPAEVDRRADLYSVAVVAFQALAGAAVRGEPGRRDPPLQAHEAGAAAVGRHGDRLAGPRRGVAREEPAARAGAALVRRRGGAGGVAAAQGRGRRG